MLAREVWRSEESAFVAGATWAPVGGAYAIVHPQVPEVWDASFVGRVPPFADPRRLLAGARQHLANHGCGHVKILLDNPATFATVGLGLKRRGMFRRVYTTLVTQSIPPEQPTKLGRVRVEPVSSPVDRKIRSSIREAVRRQSAWYAHGVGDALDTWEDIQEATLDMTWLVAYLDDEPAGAAGLLMTDNGASLQSLSTVPTLRRRGVASALIREVVKRGLQRGAPFVCLLTDVNDSPHRLYKKLGFRDVARVHEYIQAIC